MSPTPDTLYLTGTLRLDDDDDDDDDSGEC